MVSFALTVVLCVLCSDVIAARVNREDPFAELITEVRHYLSLRQTGNAGSPSVVPDTTMQNTVAKTISGSPSPATNPSVGPTTSPSNGNYSFFLDPHLYCPIVEEILMRRVSNFPKINDMTDYITVHPEMYRPLVARTMQLLAFVNDPEVASVFLVRRLTQNVVDKRLACSTAKYQQVVIYSIIQEARSAMKNQILSAKLMTILHEFPKSRDLTQRILHFMQGAVYNGIMEWVISEEFWELDSLIERFYHFSERRFGEMKNNGTPSGTWTDKFLPEMTPFMRNQRALQCTSLTKMKWNHARIAKETRKAFNEMDETGYVRRMAYRMLTEMASSFYQTEWSPKYETAFPFDKIIDVLLGYSRNVMKEIERYEQHLYNSPLMSVEPIFAEYLSTEQRQVFKSILVHLSDTVATPIPTPYPSSSPQPDWNNIKTEMQESHGDLKKVLKMITTSTGSPDDMAKIMMKVIASLDRLIQMFPVTQAL